MSDIVEKLKHELEATKRALAEAEARFVHQEAKHHDTIKETENGLRQVEEAHREWMAALDAVKEPIFMHDRDFRILRCNRAYQQHAGIPFNQIIGQPYYEVFPKTHAPLSACRKALAREEEGREEEEEVSVGNTTYRSRATVIKDKQGGYLYSMHILEEITERKQAEQIALEEKAFSDTLIENLPDIFFLIDSQGRLLRSSRQGDELFGISKEEATGTNVLTFFHEDDRPRITQKIQQAFETGATSTEARMHTKNGVRHYTLTATRFETKDGLNLLGFGIDITGRKQMEKALKESEEKYRSLFENAQIGIFMTRTSDGKLVLANDAMANMFGYDSSDEATADYIASEHYVDPKKREQLIDILRKHGRFDNIEVHLTRNDGVARWFLYSGKFVQNDHFIEGVVVDITKRKQAEKSLVLFRTLLDSSSDAIEVIEPETLQLLDVNETACRTLGYSREELLTMSIFDIDPEFTPERAKATQKKLQQEGSLSFEGLHRRKDGSTFPVEVNTTLVELDRPYLLSITHDITERKQAEQLIQDEKVFSETLIQGLPDIFVLLDEQGRMLRWNRQFGTLFGLSSQDISGRDALSFVHEDDRPRVAQSIMHVMEAGSASMEARFLMSGGIRDYLLKGMRIETKLGLNLIGIGTDITERKENETTIKHTNRALSLLSQCNTLLVHATNEQEILSGICRLAVETGGYLMAWVGFAEHDADKSVRPVAQSGHEENYLDNLHITWADTELGQGPTGTAIRTARTVISRNILTNPKMAPWREAAIKHGYQSSIALPLAINEQVLGALNIYAAETDAFSEEKEVSLLEELAGDLAYGILTLRSHKENERHSAILQQSLEQSIATIAATVEARDPYTSGHQRRAGELATAIAREMGLPEEQVNGIHLAAIIHDLGKIHVPAEILSKPGKLTDTEYKLIQEHPQNGYNILKEVKFPWPIADMILQHHERMDGSGYPQGLRGEQILLEARILAVADVVEAMSSHRPYRASLGIEAALDEIRRGRGSVYDPAVADACLKLFAEKAFAFSAQPS